MSAISPPTDHAVIRVFGLADDDVVREGVLFGIDSQPDMSVVGQATGARDAVPAITRAQPDVALVDARLRTGRGIEACPLIRRACPSVACLLMASLADERTLVEGAVAGAATIVPKQLRGTTTVDAIRAVAGGAGLFDFADTRHALDRLDGTFPAEPAAPLRPLLELMSAGRDRAEIARTLGMTEADADILVDRLLAFVGLPADAYPG